MRVNIEFSNKYTTWTNRERAYVQRDAFIRNNNLMNAYICAGNSVHI